MNVLRQKTEYLFKLKCTHTIFLKYLSSSEFCLDSIKKYDYENFICTLLLKNKARSNAIAIRAFNVEISRIQDQITDSQMGLMRMKFWENVLQTCYSKERKIPDHPVVTELHRAIKFNKFTKRYFQSLIKCRKDLLLTNNFPTLESMEKYAEQSVSNVYYLILEGSDIRNIHADHAASHLGKAQGLSQLLRSISVARNSNFIALPQDLLSECKVSHEDIIRRKNGENIKDCIFKIATRADQHLEKARKLQDDVSIDARSVLLPAVVVDSYLQRLLRVDYDIFHKSLQLRNLSWIPKVWWKKYIRTY